MRNMTHIVEYENRSNGSEQVLVIVTENEEGINAI